MKKLLANSVLIIVILFSQIYNSFVTAVYQANYNYYATELCENQNEPELHCDGKCYFSKQLALAGDNHNETEPPQLMPTLRLFSTSGFEFTAQPKLKVETEKFNEIANLFPKAPFLGAIEHPPQV